MAISSRSHLCGTKPVAKVLSRYRAGHSPESMVEWCGVTASAIRKAICRYDEDYETAKLIHAENRKALKEQEKE